MFENKLTCYVCGGDVKGEGENSPVTCVSCGISTSYPKSDVIKINRINYLRNMLYFEKAAYIASKLLEKMPEDSFIYWMLFLCEYSIQYVKTNDGYVPVCRKDVFMLPSVKENENYQKAIQFADEQSKAAYEKMGNEIEECLTKGRNAVDQNINYDVFILCREDLTADDDLDGDKIYLRFTKNLGFNVFYAPETVKDMGIVEKAACTVHALKNSKIMLAPFHSKEDTYDGFMNYSIRVFGQIADKDNEKILYPVFESSKLSFQQLPDRLPLCLEAFDSSSEEFMKEVSEKIENIIKPEAAAVEPEAIVTATSANKENLVKRAYMFLEDGEFEKADAYFDKILDIDVEDSRAYIGKLLASCKIRSEEEIPNLPQTVTDDKNYIKALRFATPEQKERYQKLNGAIVERIESEKKRISEERQRLTAEREAAMEQERLKRERQNKEERKLEYKRRQEPLKNTLAQIEAELSKTLISGKRKKELQDQQETVKKNLKELEMVFADIWD